MQRQSPGTKSSTLLALAFAKARPILLAALVFSFVTNILYLALPLYTSQVYNRVLQSESFSTLLILTFGTIFAFAVSQTVDFFQDRMLANLGVDLDRRVSGHVFAALFDRGVKREAQAGAQALRDFDTVRKVATGPGAAVVLDLPWTPLYFIILCVIDLAVGIVALIGAAILVALVFLQDRLTRERTRRANDAFNRSYHFTEAALRNSEVVGAMGMLPAMARRWNHARLEGLGAELGASLQHDLWGNTIKFVRWAVQIAVIAVGAALILDEKIGAGMLFANMILSARALAPIDRVVGTWTSLVTARQCYDRLERLLEGYSPDTAGFQMPRPAGRVTVEKVNCAVPGASKILLFNLNFAIESGEQIGLIGPSGVGKSTLLRLIIGVDRPLSGAVRLDGFDVFGVSRTQIGRHVGYLPQDVELFSGSVRDNIARFDDSVSDAEVIEAAMAANAHEMIVRLPQGYETDLGAGGQVLSAGQRQRVGLARALLRQPPLVVLDEPNANLDAEGEDALHRALLSMKERKQTAIVVSHKPSMLRDADKLLVLREGAVQLFGPREWVLGRLSGAIPPGPAPVAAPGEPARVAGGAP